jgi:hypothetical protein
MSTCCLVAQPPPPAPACHPPPRHPARCSGRKGGGSRIQTRAYAGRGGEHLPRRPAWRGLRFKQPVSFYCVMKPVLYLRVQQRLKVRCGAAVQHDNGADAWARPHLRLHVRVAPHRHQLQINTRFTAATTMGLIVKPYIELRLRRAASPKCGSQRLRRSPAQPVSGRSMHLVSQHLRWAWL